jgi:hypothetical protein
VFLHVEDFLLVLYFFYCFLFLTFLSCGTGIRERPFRAPLRHGIDLLTAVTIK